MEALIRRAVLSVSNKDGLIEFAQGLHAHGVEILASGGTRKALEARGIPALEISQYTGFPEILDGRVKTIHPKIAGGILARRLESHEASLKEHKIEWIDLVVVNLYPFRETIKKSGVTEEEAAEQIDIGGPTMIRAAAKNWERVAVVVDPSDYQKVLSAIGDKGNLDKTFRRELAAKAFAHTSGYDAVIARHLQNESFPMHLTLDLARVQSLRYGENPHQLASYYTFADQNGFSFKQLQGKELSYNNIVDIDAVWSLVREFSPQEETIVAIVKHTNPCGVAVSSTLGNAELFQRALACDPVSAFGGIVATNKAIDEEFARRLSEIFLEVVIAPDFSADALKILSAKKNLRLIQQPWEPLKTKQLQRLRSVFNGVLLQDDDVSPENLREAKQVSQRAPTSQEMADLNLAWRVCKHVKSNAIVLAKEGQAIGVGAGQMSRVDSVKLAASRAVIPIAGAAMASDAFFPFRDGVDEAAKVGIKSIVHPGGSIRDEEIIQAANEHGLAMLTTGIRHFRH